MSEKQYLNLLEDILTKGCKKEDRTKTGTLSIFGSQLRFDISNNVIPALTTKKMYIKGVIEELLFFLRGDTDTKKLEAKGINIWKGNTTREFLDKRNLTYLPEGDMGKGYGFQWRKFGEQEIDAGALCGEYPNPVILPGIDQLAQVINTLKTNPNDRRIIISAWNPAQLDQCALPPCHILVQFYVDAENKLSSQFYMRSVDSFLGLPFNILSYAIMTRIIAQTVGLEAKEIIFVGGDTHIYLNHVNQVKEQISREPFNFPKMEIKKQLKTIEDIESLSFEDFSFIDYECHPSIKAEMAV